MLLASDFLHNSKSVIYRDDGDAQGNEVERHRLVFGRFLRWYGDLRHALWGRVRHHETALDVGAPQEVPKAVAPNSEPHPFRSCSRGDESSARHLTPCRSDRAGDSHQTRAAYIRRGNEGFSVFRHRRGEGSDPTSNRLEHVETSRLVRSSSS